MVSAALQAAAARCCAELRWLRSAGIWVGNVAVRERIYGLKFPIPPPQDRDSPCQGRVCRK